uniref:ELMO domain-containing protein n=1 Tax=Panagrellus redivivus TaxID=6233 RepID=A0A7E4V7L7_PANRE
MQSLRPTLMAELLHFVGDPQRQTNLAHKAIDPQVLCQLAVSSAQMLQALMDHVKYKCNQVTTSVNDVFIIYEKVNLTGHSVQFCEDYHVKALLKIAGQNIRNIRESVPSDAWLDPFVNGLSQNNNCLIHENAGEKVFEAYAKGNDEFPEIEAPEFLNRPWKPSMLNIVKSRRIRRLSIDPLLFRGNDFMKPIGNLEIEKLHFKQAGAVIKTNIFQHYRPKMHALKELNCEYEVHTDVICNMMTLYSEVGAISFQHGVIPEPIHAASFDEVIDDMKESVSKLWITMMKYPGQNVKINARQYLYVRMPLNKLRKICKKELRNYKHFNLRGGIASLSRKVIGNKELTVSLFYWNRW